MKKVLLAGTALLGVVAMTAPAQAEINLDLGGFYRFYGVYADNDEAAGAANSLREFTFARDVEVHFNGEATTDNGLTVGVHHELDLGAGSAAVNTDETYLYMSGAYGRVNMGTEDGAAYLLQVAAPSADSNVDGLRTYIQGINLGDMTNPGGAPGSNFALEYDHADFLDTDRLTYLSPKWNGFQAGLSYAAESGSGRNVFQMNTDQNAGDFEDLWEVAARWDGEFEGFGISAGAGYSHASTEVDAGAGAAGSDDMETWNLGLNVAFQGFGVGASYGETNNGIGGVGIDADTDTLVVGLSYDNGPYHLGASWLDQENGADLYGAAGVGATGDLDIERWSFGGGYTYGPGMTFRGAVAFGSVDYNTAGVSDRDFTQVTVGTDVQF